MNFKRDFYKAIKIKIVAFLLILLLSWSSIYGVDEKVTANSEDLFSKLLYKTAWQTINEKFYFRSRVNLDKWKTKYEYRIKNLNDAHRYINKLVSVLNDPYTRFLSREEFKDEQGIINSTLIGIGVKLANKRPIVLDVLPESPAEISGIKPEDLILAVDNKKTSDLSTNEVTNLLRGSENTQLLLTIKRRNQILSKALIRKELQFKAVSAKYIDNDLALIKVDSFVPENTSSLFKEELIKLMSINGLILDLRNNSGGLLKNAIEIADMFLTEGMIVSTVGSLGKTNEFANSNQLFKNNVIILVNENTASASEIVASALKENNRAIIIGTPTYGKGLVQEIVKLPDDSALHITIAAYLTPSGKNIDKVGITPDVVIFDQERQLEKAIDILTTTTSMSNPRLKEQNTKIALGV